MSRLRARTMGAGVYDHGYVLALRAADRPHAGDGRSAAPALADPRGTGRHRDRRDRAAALLRGQRPARRHAGLGRARLRGQLGRRPGRPHRGRHQQRRRLPHRDRASGGGAGRCPCIVDARADGRRRADCRRRARWASASRPAWASRRCAAASGSTGVALCAQAGEGARDRGHRLRRGRHVGRLVAGRAPLVALRRQADLGREPAPCSAPIPTARRPARTGRPSSSRRGRANGASRAGRGAGGCDGPRRPRPRARGPRARRTRRSTSREERRRSSRSGSCRRGRATSCARRCGSTSRTT